MANKETATPRTCAVDFLDLNESEVGIAYRCGKCSLVATLTEDGWTETTSRCANYGGGGTAMIYHPPREETT